MSSYRDLEIERTEMSDKSIKKTPKRSRLWRKSWSLREMKVEFLSWIQGGREGQAPRGKRRWGRAAQLGRRKKLRAQRDRKRRKITRGIQQRRAALGQRRSNGS